MATISFGSRTEASPAPSPRAVPPCRVQMRRLVNTQKDRMKRNGVTPPLPFCVIGLEGIWVQGKIRKIRKIRANCNILRRSSARRAAELRARVSKGDSVDMRTMRGMRSKRDLAKGRCASCFSWISCPHSQQNSTEATRVGAPDAADHRWFHGGVIADGSAYPESVEESQALPVVCLCEGHHNLRSRRSFEVF